MGCLIVMLVALSGLSLFGISKLPAPWHLPLDIVLFVVVMVIAIGSRAIEKKNKEIRNTVYGIDCRTGKTYIRKEK
jgi:hypothetical protein